MNISADLPLRLVGTRGFLPALHVYIRNVANSPSLPLDHVIFRSFLLCLIAGEKHLILRTPEEDVGLTIKLTVWVSLICFLTPTPLNLRVEWPHGHQVTAFLVLYSSGHYHEADISVRNACVFALG